MKPWKVNLLRVWNLYILFLFDFVFFLCFVFCIFSSLSSPNAPSQFDITNTIFDFNFSLGDAIAASNSSTAVVAKNTEMALDVSSSSSVPSFMVENKENLPLRPRSSGDLSITQTSDMSIQSLIEKMHTSLDVSY